MIQSFAEATTHTHEVPAMQVARGIIRTEAGGILLVRRHKHAANNTNKYELPGGKYELGDNFHKAVIREVFEETGLEVMPHGESWVTEERPMSPRRGSSYTGLYVAKASLVDVTGGSFRPQAEEVADVIFLTPPEIDTLRHDCSVQTIVALGFAGLLQ